MSIVLNQHRMIAVFGIGTKIFGLDILWLLSRMLKLLWINGVLVKNRASFLNVIQKGKKLLPQTISPP